MIDYFELVLRLLKKIIGQALEAGYPYLPVEGYPQGFTLLSCVTNFATKSRCYAPHHALPGANPIVFSPLAGLFI